MNVLFDIATSLILSNRLQFEAGEIKFLGTNVCLIPPEVYLFLYKELENRNQEKIFYETSKTSAFNWFTNLAEVMGKTDTNRLIESVPKILNLLAYGKVDILKKDLPNAYFEFSLRSPLFPELYGKSSKPIDFGFAGLLAGSLSAIIKREMVCYEKECVSQGAMYCTFVVTGRGN